MNIALWLLGLLALSIFNGFLGYKFPEYSLAVLMWAVLSGIAWGLMVPIT